MKKSDGTRWVFWVCLASSIILLIVSFLLPPMGIIDASVLTSVGELFAFAALYEGISLVRQGRSAKLTHNGTELEISASEALSEV